ncbi:MAG: WYL domain-containing protein [Steroidobacteraceae bacterium]
MEQTERIYWIKRRLVQKGSFTREEVMARFEYSRASFKRDLDYLRDRLNMPVEWSTSKQAYVVAPGTVLEELPGVWFSAAEVQGLLTIEHLLESLGSAPLAAQLAPARRRLEQLIDAGHEHDELRRRIRVLPMAGRPVDAGVFETLSVAVLGRRRVVITHLNRASGETMEREVSPQRLVHYRYNWYLDAYCHLRHDIRSFAVDAIRGARLLDARAVEIEDARLDAVLRAGYGIFSGEATDTAVLRFSPAAARWVAHETWHSRQQGRFEADGSYRLELPYSHPAELVMDILRHGAEVEVLAPPELRERVVAELAAAARRYAGAGD